MLVVSLGAAPAFADDELARLESGEILAQSIHEDKSGGAARVTGLIHATAEELWDIINRCENEFIYVRGLELCEVVVPGQQYIKKHHRVNNNWYTPTLDFVFEARRLSATYGTFNLVEGNLKVMEGHWTVRPAPDGGLVVSHELRIRSKLPAPRWLVRRVLKKDLPDMLACVRGLARGSVDAQLLARDLDRCPGDVSSLVN